jgi:hypothetical protein
MTITVADLKFFQSERMIDEDDGGGQMVATEIVSGQSNQIFDDVSDVDRAIGDVSLRKVYAAVTSANTDKYLDAGVVVFKAPADPNVSVLATSTGNFYDERTDIQAYLESYLIRGARFFGFLYGTQIEGTRALTWFCRTEDEPPGVNTTLSLAEFTTTAYETESYGQYVRIIRILSNDVQNFTDDSGTYQRRIITVELSEALRYTFHGTDVSRLDDVKPLAVMYATLVADAARYYGVRPFTAQATSGALSVTVDAISTRIVPTSQVETPILDANAATERVFAVPAALDAVSFTIGDTFSPNFNLYVGRAIVPGSLSITILGGTLTDSGGQLLSGVIIIGTVAYTAGLVTFAADAPTYSGSKTVTFRPAAPLARVTNSFGIPVRANTRYRTYVASLRPIPNAGTLIVDYMSAGNWYRLTEAGAGVLAGSSVSYGAGTINFDTGSCSVTLGALPDINSMILFSYGSGADTRSLTATETLVWNLATGEVGLVPGDQTLAWSGNTLTDQGDGTMTGTGGSAVIHYASGMIDLTPTNLPAGGTVFTLTGNRYATAQRYTETFSPTADGNGVISLTLGHQSIDDASVELWYYASSNPDDAPGVETLTKYLGRQGNGAGGWQGATGTINAAAGTLTLDTDITLITGIPIPTYEYVPRIVEVWDDGTDTWVTQTIVEQILVGHTITPTVVGRLETGSTVTITYALTQTPIAIDKTLTPTLLTFGLAPATGETLVNNSLRFTLGNRLYQDVNGQMVYAWNPVTGTGTVAGSLDTTTGQITLTDWPATANSLIIAARAVRYLRVPCSRVVFRTPAAPIATNSFSFRVKIYPTEEVLEASADEFGVISGSVVISFGYYGTLVTIIALGRIDYQTGVVDVYFGANVEVDFDVRAQNWYIAEAEHDGFILHPVMVDLSTLLYNCVTYTTLPLDSSIIGMDPVRFPSDGQVPLYRPGQLALAHHTATISANSLSPTQVIDCGRLRLYRVVIDDADLKRFPASFYAVDREAGTVTMASDLNLTGYTAPYAIQHTVADLTVVSDADLSGLVTLTRPLSHTYPATTSRLSSVLYVGTLQARYTNLFMQSAWTSVWSDERIGDEPLAQYNDVTYPLVVSNLGAYPDRYLIRFTSSTAFVCYGENLGYLGAGTINENFGPINPLTNAAYFTLDYRGWGGGFATGYCLRFNLVGACYPVDFIRAIQPSEPTGADDSVEVLFIGNID